MLKHGLQLCHATAQVIESTFARLLIGIVSCGLLVVVLFEHLAEVAFEARDEFLLLIGLRRSD